jgi:tetratricopeptide (TPR) repeat protein
MVPGGAEGRDTVIWDADELEEEVDTEEVELENFGSPYGISDDVIFFGSSKVETDNRSLEHPPPKKKEIAPPEPVDAPSRARRHPPSKPANATTPKALPAQKTPSDPEVERFFTLGQKAADQKEYLKAIQHFTKVTQLAADDPRGYYNLAIVSFRLKFYETAREHAKRALELGAGTAQRIIDKIDAHQATV